MHTPGPWINDGTTISARPDPENSLTYVAPVCTMDQDWTPEIMAANARLIASAPDLLAALRKVSTCLAAWMEIADPGDLREYDDWALGEARAAIEQATGEQA